MKKREEETAFYKTLIRQADAAVQGRLTGEIDAAARDETCCWRAMRAMGVMGFACFCGIGYAILVPDFSPRVTRGVVQIIAVMGLASLLSAVAFLGFWLWHRAHLNHLCRESRRMILASLGSGTPVRAEESRPAPLG